MPAEFAEFRKIPRLRRDCTITEKIDGTNAQVLISPLIEPAAASEFALKTLALPDGTSVEILAGSKNRWLTRTADNFGFAHWVYDNAEELLKLGAGRHFGEWWGAGIQRKYGLKDKRFSLFNVTKWTPETLPTSKVTVVPVILRGPFSDDAVSMALDTLKSGSLASPGFPHPEGIVIHMESSGHLYKITLDGDGHKGEKA